MKYAKQIGSIVRVAREKKGLTQSEFGNAIGKSTKTISCIENGLVTTSLDTFMKMAAVLKKPPWQLFLFAQSIKPAERRRLDRISKICLKLDRYTDKQLDVISQLMDAMDEQATQKLQ